MKNKQTLMASIFILLIVSFSSCKKKNDEKNVEKFVGSYSINEACAGGDDNYQIAITQSTSADNEILIGNFYNYGALVKATVSENNLTIPSQIVNGVTYSGNGILNNDKLTLNFSVDGTSCVASGQKI